MIYCSLVKLKHKKSFPYLSNFGLELFCGKSTEDVKGEKKNLCRLT